jgi:DNA-binding NarL/FixJ family response regulator
MAKKRVGRARVENELTARQHAVLKGLLSGSNEQAIATKLRLSVHTVHHHVKAIYRNLCVHSRRELLSKFIEADAIASLRS